jgi:hypothetical protein
MLVEIKRLASGKRSSLFGLFVSGIEKQFKTLTLEDHTITILSKRQRIEETSKYFICNSLKNELNSNIGLWFASFC